MGDYNNILSDYVSLINSDESINDIAKEHLVSYNKSNK